MTPPILYISGPFNSEDQLHGIEQNILNASKYSLEAWKLEWAVICPHKNTSGFQHVNIPFDVWIQGDLAFIDRMNPDNGDSLLMLPNWGLSMGAKIEREFAIEKGLSVYYSLEMLPKIADI